jgi:hypothetical protein
MDSGFCILAVVLDSLNFELNERIVGAAQTVGHQIEPRKS